MSGSVAARLETFTDGVGGVVTAYLFGSAARNELRPDSDVGVLFAEACAGGTDACLALEERLERLIGQRTQVVDLLAFVT